MRSSESWASACRTELRERVNELEFQQVDQWFKCPRGLGSPEELQELGRSCHLEQIYIIVQALDNEHEYL